LSHRSTAAVECGSVCQHSAATAHRKGAQQQMRAGQGSAMMMAEG